MRFHPAVHTYWDKMTHGDYTWTNIAWLFFDNLIRQGLGLFVLIMMARILGPTDFGNLSYALAFTSLIWSFTSLGLPSLMVRNLVREPENTSTLIGSAFLLRGAATILAWMVVWLGIRWLSPSNIATQKLAIILATGMVFQITDTFVWWFEALVLAKYVVMVRCIAFLISATVKAVLLWNRAPLWSFAATSAIEMALAGIGITIIYWVKNRRGPRFTFDLKTMVSLLKDCWPLAFSNLAILLYMRIDQIMLGKMRSNTEVGIYSVVVMVAEAGCVLPMIVMPSLLPRIVAAKEISEAAFQEQIIRLYRLIALLAYVVALPLILFSDWLVPMVFGASYTSGGPVLAVLAFAGIFSFMGVARSALLVTMNWNRIYLASVAISCLINIVLNLVLIPRWGALGAAIASAAAYWFAVFGICFIYKPLRPTGMMLANALLYPKFWK